MMQDFNLTESTIVVETTPLRFGIGVTQEIGYVLHQHGIRKALLVTDPHLKEAGLVGPVEKLIDAADIEVETYAEARAEPTDKSFEAAIAAQKGKTFEAYIALGGGSVIDTAKAMNLYGTYPAALTDYINKPIGAARPVPGPLKPLIAVPTTAGTGSESTPVIVLDLLELKVKTGISHPAIRPTAALIDPLNTLSMPPAVTAASGLDVLCHALESYISRPYHTRLRPASPAERATYLGANPIADLFCERAIELVGKYLRRAYFNPTDIEARSNMMLAATFAGMGLGSAGVHLPHAMGYPVAGKVRKYRMRGYPTTEPMVPHGVSCIVNAPAAFRYTIPAWPERHAKAAALMGLDTGGLSTQAAAQALPEGLIQLMRDLAQPNGLHELGYSLADIPALVGGTLQQQRLLVNSPRPVSEAALSQIFQDAMRYW